MSVPGINSAEVIDAIRARGERWKGIDRPPDGKTIGLIVEGGAMRGIRSAGALLALDAMGLSEVFDQVYGCSAGAVNACYFLAGQAAYGTTIYYQNINNTKFINRFRLHKIADLDFVFDHVLVNEKPLQVSRIMRSPSKLYISVTDVASASGRLLRPNETNESLFKLLKASSAMPIAYNSPILIDGRQYIDGGVSNCIPLADAMANGCTHILVLLTRPEAYRNPDPGRIERFFFKSTCGKGNPALCKLHLRSDGDTNGMRDLAFGRTTSAKPVSIATLAPSPADAPVDRMTVDTARLKTAAIQNARRTYEAFSVDPQQMVEVFHPFSFSGSEKIADNPAVAGDGRSRIESRSKLPDGFSIEKKGAAMRWLLRGGAALCLILVTARFMGYRWLPNQSVSPAVASAHARGAATNPAERDAIVYDFNGAAGSDGDGPAPWQSRVIAGQMKVSVVNAGPAAGENALQMHSEKSHFVLYNGSKQYDPGRYPILKWSWKAQTLPTNGDVRTHDASWFSSNNHNDAALQVLVGFDGGDVLCYIWDSTAPVGTEVDEWSPVAKIKTRVVDSGASNLNIWKNQSVNVYDDYQRRFGKTPGKVIGVSVQINSNHTKSIADGLVGAISAERP